MHGQPRVARWVQPMTSGLFEMTSAQCTPPRTKDFIDNWFIKSYKVNFVQNKTRGFTLIELMIAVATIGILSAIAYPSFMSSIRKARREDAHVLLLSAQQAQEKHRLTNATYTNALASLVGVCPATGTCFSPEGYYQLAAPTSTSATAYTLTATAVSGKSQASDSGCTTIAVVVSNMSITRSQPDCWSK